MLQHFGGASGGEGGDGAVTGSGGGGREGFAGVWWHSAQALHLQRLQFAYQSLPHQGKHAS